MAGETEEPNPFEGFISETTDKDGKVTVHENKAVVKGADDAAKAEDGAEKSEADQAAADEAEAAAAAAADKDEDDEDDGTELSENVRKRIGKLTAKRRAAEREADESKGRIAAMEAELAALRSGKKPEPDLTKTPPAPKSAPKAPDPKDFKYGEIDAGYIAAVAKHAAKEAADEAITAADAKAEDKRKRDADDAKASEFTRKTTAAFEAGKKLHADFDTVVVKGAAQGKWKLSPELGELALNAEEGPAILYHLASDPKFADELFSKSPLEQAAAFGALQERFKKPAANTPPAKKISGAPAPLATGVKGGGGKAATRSNTTDFAQFEALATQRK